MSKNKISAKDVAFEKERAKYRQQIRALEADAKKAKIAMLTAEDALREKEREVEQLKDHIERLLEYTEMSKEDFEILLEGEKRKTELRELMSAYNSIVRLF